MESSEGVAIALANGVDTIEHGAKANDEILRLFHERKAALVTTLSPALPLRYLIGKFHMPVNSNNTTERLFLKVLSTVPNNV